MNRATTETATPAIGGSFTISRSSSTVDIGTFGDDFRAEKPRPSGKPPLRPSRRRPALRPMTIEIDPEEAARLRLQRRMPPRSRIQAILDRRPARDPWLDDGYDGRP